MVGSLSGRKLGHVHDRLRDAHRALLPDRLAHRRRLAVLSSYFEHVLQLPLAYHGETHSGRLMKIMLQGTDALWAFWLEVFP